MPDDLHPDFWSTNSLPPPYPGGNRTNYAQSCGSTVATPPLSTNPDTLATEDYLLLVPPIHKNYAVPEIINTIPLVGSTATKSPSQRERQYYPSPRYHPYQRLFLHKGLPTSHRETHSKATTLSGDLCAARPNEDALGYAVRMAARTENAEGSEGTPKLQDGSPETYPYIVICPPLSSLINPITHLSFQEPGCATKFATKFDTPCPSQIFSASGCKLLTIDLTFHPCCFRSV